MPKINVEINDVDLILKLLYTTKVYQTHRTIVDIVLNHKHHGEVPLSNWDLVAFDKLTRDKYVIENKDSPNGSVRYNISFEGAQFYRKGGYAGQAKRDLYKKQMDFIESMPKRFWFISILLTSLGFNIVTFSQNIYRELFHSSKEIKQTPPARQSKVS